MPSTAVSANCCCFGKVKRAQRGVACKETLKRQKLEFFQKHGAGSLRSLLPPPSRSPLSNPQVLYSLASLSLAPTLYSSLPPGPLGSEDARSPRWGRSFLQQQGSDTCCLEDVLFVEKKHVSNSSVRKCNNRCYMNINIESSS